MRHERRRPVTQYVDQSRNGVDPSQKVATPSRKVVDPSRKVSIRHHRRQAVTEGVGPVPIRHQRCRPVTTYIHQARKVVDPSRQVVYPATKQASRIGTIKTRQSMYGGRNSVPCIFRRSSTRSVDPSGEGVEGGRKHTAPGDRLKADANTYIPVVSFRSATNVYQVPCIQ